MHEYEKKNAKRGAQQNSESMRSEMTNGIPNSALQDVMAGKRHADSSMMGHSRNLAPSIAAKMSRSFGMDLTGMQVYRSDAMVGSGMQGMASGNKVVLSSDVDLNTTAGQAVLGHEISHIHAQSQGIGMGNSGLYENAVLEHQADTEGLLAAQGRSIYQSGMDMGGGMSYGLGMQGVEGMTTLGGGMSASAGAPMQAKKDEEDMSPKGDKPYGEYKQFLDMKPDEETENAWLESWQRDTGKKGMKSFKKTGRYKEQLSEFRKDAYENYLKGKARNILKAREEKDKNKPKIQQKDVPMEMSEEEKRMRKQEQINALSKTDQIKYFHAKDRGDTNEMEQLLNKGQKVAGSRNQGERNLAINMKKFFEQSKNQEKTKKIEYYSISGEGNNVSAADKLYKEYSKN